MKKKLKTLGPGINIIIRAQNRISDILDFDDYI